MLYKNKHYNYKTLSGVLVVSMFMWLLLSNPGSLQSLHILLEQPVANYHAIPSANSSAAIRAKKNSSITIVYIDRRSLADQGPWPWSGKQYTSLLNRLINNGADNIAFDIPISTNKRNSALQVYDWIKENRNLSPATARVLNHAQTHFNYNKKFTKRLVDQDIILSFEFTPKQIPSIGYLPSPLEFKNKISMRSIPHTNSYIGNFREVQQAGLNGGFNNLTPKQTSLLYHTALLKRYGSQIYPSLSLQIARNILESRKIWLHTRSNDINYLTGVKIDETLVPTDKNGHVRFKLQGPPGTIPSLSATDLINGNLSKKIIDSKIRDKTIIISSNLDYIKPNIKVNQYLYTPAEIQANLIASIITNKMFAAPANFIHFDAYMLAITGLVLILLFPSASKRQRRIITLAAIISWLTYHLSLYASVMYVSALTIPVLMILGLLLLHQLADNDYVILRLSLFIRWIRTTFPVLNFGGSYDNNDSQILKQESSVLLVHIRNFSKLSEHINPVELNKILGLFSNPIASLINRHQGLVTQHIGHTILAVWPAQSDSETNIEKALEQAISCALKIRHIASTLKSRLSKKGLPELEVCIGIDSGPIKTRSLAWQAKLACGQVVDNAGKLADLCEFYGVNIIVCHPKNKTSPEFYYRQLDILDIPGHGKETAIFEPMCLIANIDLCDYYELQLYERALEFFMEDNKEHATSFFQYLNKARPKRLIYEKYLKELGKRKFYNFKEGHTPGLLNKRTLNHESTS